jgi:hypothetical protein
MSPTLQGLHVYSEFNIPPNLKFRVTSYRNYTY